VPPFEVPVPQGPVPQKMAKTAVGGLPYDPGSMTSVHVPALRVHTKISYGIGQLGEGIKNSSFELFLFFYYNQVLGVSATLAGAATLVALAIDAVFDPVAGSISDSFRSRWGRRHPFMYAGAVPFGLMFYLLFAPPAGLSELGLFL
jgi:Na+/melibiose symporter-like transporter